MHIDIGPSRNRHHFEVGGRRFLLDVPSGSIHELDELAWQVWKALVDSACDGKAQVSDVKERLGGQISPQLVEQILGEFKKLAAAGLLFVSDPTQEAPPTLPSGLKALCLHLAHDCNLRCRYCFAATGHFGGKRELMPLGVGKSAIDLLIEQSGNRRNLEVDFFGGEPLMNYEVLVSLVRYIRERETEAGKVFKLTLTTNALLLNEEMLEFLNQEEIALVLSLDGRPRIQNHMRPGTSGESTYEETVGKIREVVDSREGEGYYVRGTFTAENLDFVADVLHLADLGFYNISLEPVVSRGTSFAIGESDLPRVKAEYERLAEAFMARYRAGRPFSFFHFNMDLRRGPCLAKRLSGCGAGVEYMAVSPSGSLYPCHQFVGQEEYCLGHVDQGMNQTDLMDDFSAAHVLEKPACQTCWARYYCSGGCHANAVLFNNDIMNPYEIGCQLERKRLECSFWIQSELAWEDEERLARVRRMAEKDLG